MRILVLSDRFHPEVAAPSVRIIDHARIWMAQGHEVTVVTGAPNFPRGRVFPGYRNRLYQEESIEGIRTIRVWSYMAPNQGFLRRIIDYLSLVASSLLWTYRLPRFDVILATSPPLFTALQGRLLGLLRRKPWVFEVRDLWPASIRAVGAGRGRLLDVLERLELHLYRRADRIVLLTESFQRDLISRGVPADRCRVARNGVAADHFVPRRSRADIRVELGLPEDVFLAAYIGTTGMAHGLVTLVEAASRLKGDERIHILIMGEGAERERLESQVRERNLSNVSFRDFAPHAEVPSYLAAADASVVHLRPDPLFKTVIPSKIFEAMAVGTPLVMAVEGEAAALVRDADAGPCIAAGDAQALADAVRHLADHPELCARHAEAGRRAARGPFSRTAGAMQVLHALEDACGPSLRARA